MSFQISGLSGADFASLFDLTDAQLAARGMSRLQADSDFGYPDRISLADASIGEDLILLSYDHQPASSPFKACGPIFVSRRAGADPVSHLDFVPASLARRPISLRAYDEAGMMIDAELVDGAVLAGVIERQLSNNNVSYLHAHYALRGCFAARIDRV
jgi:hypothetical protein